MRTSLEKVMIFLEIDNTSIDFLRKSIEKILIFLEIHRKTSPAARNRGQGLAGTSEELAELQNIPQYRAQERARDHPRTGQGPVRKHYFFVIFFVLESGCVLARERPGTGRKKRGICRAAVYSAVQIRGQSRGPSEVRPGTVPKTLFFRNSF